MAYGGYGGGYFKGGSNAAKPAAPRLPFANGVPLKGPGSYGRPQAPGVSQPYGIGPKPPLMPYKPFGQGSNPYVPNNGSPTQGQAPAGAPPAAAPAQAPAGQQSPYDAQYYLNVGQNQFSTNQKINALDQSQAYDTTNLQSALAKLAYQQPRAELAMEQKANAGNSLYSSAYNQNLGNLNYSYLGQQGGLQDNYAKQMAAIGSQRAGLQGSENLYELGQAYAASQRASAAAAKDPSAGMPAPAINGVPVGTAAGTGGSVARGGANLPKGLTGKLTGTPGVPGATWNQTSKGPISVLPLNTKAQQQYGATHRLVANKGGWLKGYHAVAKG